MRYLCLFIFLISFPFCFLHSRQLDLPIQCSLCCSEDNPDMHELSRTFYRTIKKIGLLNEHSAYRNARKVTINWSYDLTKWYQNGYSWIDGYSVFDRYFFDNFDDSEPDDDDGAHFYSDTEYDLTCYSHFADACTFAYSDLRLLHELNLRSSQDSLKSCTESRTKGLRDLESTLRALQNSKDENTRKALIEHKNWLEKESIASCDKGIARENNYQKEIQETYLANVKRLQGAEKKINNLYDKLFASCAEHHHHPNAYYQRGLQQFYLGQMENAVDDMAKVIDAAEKDAKFELPKDTELVSGKMQA